jgi:transposase
MRHGCARVARPAARRGAARAANANALSMRPRALIASWRDVRSRLDIEVARLEQVLEHKAACGPHCQRQRALPGAGTLTATARVAAVGRADVFLHGRDLEALPGALPRQHTNGGKPRLLGIRTQGNT